MTVDAAARRAPAARRSRSTSSTARRRARRRASCIAARQLARTCLRGVRVAAALRPQIASRHMILAIDQGTTGTTCLRVRRARRGCARRAYREFTQHFPRPGWVEHDAEEIWEVTRAVAHEALGAAGVAGRRPRRDRDHQPARDRRRLGRAHRRAAAQRDRLAGPPDRGALRRGSARRASRTSCASAPGS